MNPVDEFPAELSDRLQRLVDLETSGSSPWPGVDRAMQRAHHRRMAGVSTLVAASVLAGGLVFNGLGDPKALQEPVAPAITAPPSPAATVVPIKKNLTPAQAGYTGATGGSLGGDRTWLTTLRTRVSWLIGREGEVPNTKADIRVLWAGDLDGKRYAVVLFRYVDPLKPHGKTWNTVTMVGRKGANPGTMTNSGYRTIGAGLSTAPQAEFLRDQDDTRPSKGTVVVLAPKASSVEVATSRSFAPDGTVTTTWRSLEQPTGPVWIARLNQAELQLADYRVDGSPEGGFNRDDFLSSADDGYAAVAATGTDPDALRRADEQAQLLGASLSERAVLATGIPLGKKNALAATVLRSPAGGYLIGFAERQVYSPDILNVPLKPGARTLMARIISRQPFPSSDAVMVAVMMPESEKSKPELPGRHDIVLAPVGAVTIRIGDRSAKVRNRLAVLNLPNQQFAATDPPDQVQALDAAGRVIGTATAFNGLPGADPQIAHVDAVIDHSRILPAGSK